MKKKLWFQMFVLLSLVGLLLFIPANGQASNPVGSSFIIAGDSEEEVSPAIAYNSQAHEYLVVWFNDRPGCDDIRAQRVATNGALVGPPFYISAECPANRQFPDVTYNSKHNQYLVVWEQFGESSGYSIQARRVSGTGQVLDAMDIPIRSSGYNLYTPRKPAVAYASTSDRYLVVWSETWHPGSITYGIYGQVVSDAGTLEGSEFTISQGSEPHTEPDLAYNRNSNRYLVVWQQQAGSLWDIHAQQVHGGGGIFQGDLQIAYRTVASTAPTVAALPDVNSYEKFLVVWELHYAANDRDIRGSLVSEGGTVYPAFDIAADGIDDSNPAIVGIENNSQYYVVYKHSIGGINNPIRGQAIWYYGTLQDQAFDLRGVYADNPAVAGGYLSDCLVVWQDQPLGNNDMNIYGQILGNRTYLPLALRIAK
jgi:hypothetical protein